MTIKEASEDQANLKKIVDFRTQLDRVRLRIIRSIEFYQSNPNVTPEALPALQLALNNMVKVIQQLTMLESRVSQVYEAKRNRSGYVQQLEQIALRQTNLCTDASNESIRTLDIADKYLIK